MNISTLGEVPVGEFWMVLENDFYYREDYGEQTRVPYLRVKTFFTTEELKEFITEGYRDRAYKILKCTHVQPKINITVDI